MSMQYPNNLKKKLCEEICIDGKSTIKSAKAYSIPLKTLEKWITSYHKNPHCFDDDSSYFSNDFQLIDYPSKDPLYDDLSNEELKNMLMKKDIEIARLKKGYLVKGVGTENKVFVTLSKKNTK